MLPFMRIVRLGVLVAMNTVLEGEIQYNLVEKYHLGIRAVSILSLQQYS